MRGSHRTDFFPRRNSPVLRTWEIRLTAPQPPLSCALRAFFLPAARLVPSLRRMALNGPGANRLGAVVLHASNPLGRVAMRGSPCRRTPQALLPQKLGSPLPAFGRQLWRCALRVRVRIRLGQRHSDGDLDVSLRYISRNGCELCCPTRDGTKGGACPRPKNHRIRMGLWPKFLSA